jgi:LuxR family maltose regulon positive regulatory protein
MTRSATRPDPATAANPLIPSTKLEPPRSRREHIGRPALLERLAASTLPTLAVVTAPAGYGKSTLLAELARRSEAGVVSWLSIDEDDADPARFWVGFTATLGKSRPDSFDPVVRLARAGVDPHATLIPPPATVLQSPAIACKTKMEYRHQT